LKDVTKRIAVVRLPGKPQSELDKKIAKDEAEYFSVQLNEARDSGRYPLDVAATLIAQVAGVFVSADKMEERLMLAAQGGSLPVYVTGETVRWDGAIPFFGIVEAYWDDLNTWLAENESRIGCLFQDPDAPAPHKMKAIKGMTKQQVIDAFEGLHFTTGAQWSKALADVPKWLEPCRVMKGSKKASALWNPAQIAVALYDKKIPIKKLDAVFVGLNAWTDEWQKTSELLR
jgi:hypothetical protein